MPHLGKLKSEIKEDLADLWMDKKFQTFIKLLRGRRNKLALACLKTRDLELIKELQVEADLITKIIGSVQEAYKELNREKE